MKDKITAELEAAGLNTQSLQDGLLKSVEYINNLFDEQPTDILLCTKLGDNNISAFHSAWFVYDKIFYELKSFGENIDIDRVRIKEPVYIVIKSSLWDFSASPQKNSTIEIKLSFDTDLSGRLCGTGNNVLSVLKFYKAHILPLVR